MASYSWKVSSGGDWSNAVDWLGGVPNSATAVVTIAHSGTYTVDISSGESYTVGSITLGDAGATLQIDGTLTLTNTLTLTKGSLYLDGTIQGGTIVDPNGALVAAGGTLSGVTYQGALNLTGNGADINIAGGLTLTGANGKGAGTVNDTGGYSALAFSDTETFDNATINIGNSYYNSNYASLITETNATGVLTLGTGVTINHVGVYATIGQSFYGGQGAIVNDGSIVANLSGGQFLINPVTFTNNGSIAVSNGDTLTIDPTNFTNAAAGTITVGKGSSVYIQNTSSGTFANAGTITINGTTALFDVQSGTLTNTGTIALTAGTLEVDNTLSSGVIALGSAGVITGGGTLDGVTVQGALNLTGNGADINIAGGLTLTGANGKGAGTVDDTGYYSDLAFSDTETFDNATINIGNAYANSNYASAISETNATSVLTLGAGVTINHTGTYATIGQSYYGGTGAIVNDGSIVANLSGGQFLINPVTFTNNGSIAVSNGDTFTVDPTNFTNAAAGTITVGKGSSVYIQNTSSGTFANAGTITINGTTALFDVQSGTLTNTGTIALTAGTLEVDGTLSSTTTLSLAGGTLDVSGTVMNTTIALGSTGVVTGYGTLDGVTVQGAWTVTGTLNVADGITLTGTGGTGTGSATIANYGSLNFTNSATLDKASVTVGGTATNGDYAQLTASGTGTVLTLGSGLTVTLGTYGFLNGTAIVNDGTINAATNTTQTGWDPSIDPTSFTNQGAINVSNKDTLRIGYDPYFGDVTTSFTNAAAGTITIGANSAVDLYNNDSGTFTNAGTITINGSGAVFDIEQGIFTNTGAITLTAGTLEVDGMLSSTTTLSLAGGTLDVSGTVKNSTIALGTTGVVTGGGTLDGVTVQGVLNLNTQSSQLFIADGLALTGAGGTGAGTINLTGRYSSLLFTTSGTIDNATINMGAASAFIDLYGKTGLTLTLGANLTIAASGGNSDYLGGYEGYGGTITNNGTITVSNGTTLYIDPGSLTNNGSITDSGGGLINLQPTKFTNLSGTTLTGGYYEADAGSTIEISQNAQIATDDATIVVRGAGSVIEGYKTAQGKELTLDATLTTIGATGVLKIVGARNWTTTNAMTNDGSLVLGGGTFTAASLTNAAGADFSGYGTVATTIANAGTIEASSGLLTLQSAVTGTGGFQIDAGSTLALAAAIPSAAGILFNGAGAVLALTPSAGFTNVLSGLTPTDAIDLLKTAATNVVLNASNQLVVTNNGAAVATFNLNGNYADYDFSTVSDNNGGTFVLVSPDQAPVTTAPATLFDNAGATVAVTGVNVTDGDAVAYNETTTVVLSDATGILSATAAAGATVTGAGTNAMTLSGSLAAVDAELATLTYTGAFSNGPLTDTIDVTTNDGRGGSNDQKIQVTIDQPPVTTVPASLLIQTGAVTPIAGVSVADPDAVSLGQTITVVITDGAGILSATAAAGATVTGGGTNALTLSGGLVAVDAELATLSYDAPTSGAPLTDTITVATNDGAGGSNTGTIAVALNQPPANTAPATLSAITGTPTPVAGVSVADGDAVSAGETITVKLTDTVGLLSAKAEAGATVSGSGTKALTLSGSLAGVDAELATLVYKGVLTGTAASTTDTITFSTSDGRGGTATSTIAVKINHVPPVIAAAPAFKVLSGQTVALSGFTLTDTDALSVGGKFTVTLTDKHGALSATAETGATVTGAGTTKLVLAGSLAGVQAELATLTYTGGTTGTKATVNDIITINAQDSRSGTATARSTNVTIDHLPPVTTVPGPVKVASNVATPIAGISVADADPTAGSAVFKVTLTDKLGLLSATAAAGGTVAGNNSKKLTLSGSLAAVDAELATLTYKDKLSGTAASANDTITVTTADNHGLGDKHTIGVTVTPSGAISPAQEMQAAQANRLAVLIQSIAAFSGAGAGLMSTGPRLDETPHWLAHGH